MESLNIPLDRLLHLRQQVLHRYPELSGEETETANQIAAFLSSCNPDEIIKNIGGHGVAAVFNGESKGPVVMLRAELDALAIEESDQLAYHSANDGVSHKCGHDGHMAILCGVATLLQQNRPASGKVILLFQPAEENGKGAVSVLNDEKFVAHSPDWVFALHNLPGFPEKSVVVKDGQFTPAVNSVIVKFEGHTAHAAEPEKGINPAIAMAELTLQMTKWTENSDPASFSIITPVYQQLGEKAYGVSAGAGEAHFTIRCDSSDKMKKLEQKTEKLAKQIGEKHKLETNVSWVEAFYSSFNDEQAMHFVRSAAEAVGAEIIETAHPFKWGEDFGLFTQKYRGAMFCVGAGVDHPVLHHPNYDFPDEITETAIAVFYRLIYEITHV